MKVTNIVKHLGKILGFALLIAIFFMVFGVYWQITHGENADYQEVKEAIIQFGNDLNEMRDYLYLPQNEYAFFQSESEVDLSNMEAPEDNAYQKGVSLFAEDLAKAQTLKKAQEASKATINGWINDAEFIQALTEANLKFDGEVNVNESHAMIKVMQGDQAVVQLLVDLKNQSLSAQSIRGIEGIEAAEGQAPKAAILNYLKKNTEAILALKAKVEAQKTAMTGLLESEEVQQIVKTNTLGLNVDPVATPNGLEYYATDLDGSPLLTIILIPKTAELEMEDVMYLSADNLKLPLLQKLKSLNGETNQIRALRQKEEGLSTYLKSDAFLETGLKVSEAQEAESQVIYDLIYAETESILGQIIFDRLTGEVRFREAGSDLDYSLEEILSGSKKKALILPDQLPATETNRQEADKINFLIGGKHGSNMDTMIVAQVDTVNRNVKMVSIPRDLQMDGRKLNSYSVEQIKKYLGTITGLHIDHHMIIDMYAYIEVVDILGGIDIYLNEPVVDPTYKTLDNGVWGTLNYPVGWHHMSGVQSLRIARSRHTSSDFVRAERQQQILRALKEKINSLDVSNGAELAQIAGTILNKIETDMDLKQILSYYFKFKSFEVEPRGGLTSGNVLISDMYVSPQAQAATANCQIQRANSTETVSVQCPSAKAAYILIPRTDWNAVRWYVSELLKD